MKYKKLILLAVAVVGVASFASAQVLYQSSVSGLINNAIPGILSADVKIEFLEDAGPINTDQIKVTITNTSTTASLLNAFYLLKPVVGGTPLSPPDPQGTSDENPKELLDASTGSVPDDWILDADGSTEFQQFAGSWDMTDYFGAHGGNRLEDPSTAGVVSDSTGTFIFTFNNNFSFSDWNVVQNAPAIFVRWQEVQIPGGAGGQSGKGGGGPGWEPGNVVPEPSEVALMAMLGLGGILFARKRFFGKKK